MWSVLNDSALTGGSSSIHDRTFCCKRIAIEHFVVRELLFINMLHFIRKICFNVKVLRGMFSFKLFRLRFK